jgi:hypothetical protein
MIGINRRHVAACLIAAAGFASAGVAQAAQASTASAARPAASSVKVTLKIGHCGKFSGTVTTGGAGTKRDAAYLRVNGHLSNSCGISFLQIRYTVGKKTVPMKTIQFDGFHQTFPVTWHTNSTSGTFSKVYMRLGNPFPKSEPIVWEKWVKA